MKLWEVKFRFFILGGIFCILLSGIFLQVEPNREILNPEIQSSLDLIQPDQPNYPEIPPINITNNENITTYASSGDGLTLESAYIIENFQINGSSNAIHISNTNKYLKLLNFELEYNLNESIQLINVSNIHIENGIIGGNFSSNKEQIGISAINSSNIIITNTDILNRFDCGLFFQNTHQITINSVYTYMNDEIFNFIDSSQIFFSDSIFTQGYSWKPYYQNSFVDCEDVILKGIRWHTDWIEMHINSSNNIVVEENTVDYTFMYQDFCKVYSSTNVLIRNNQIIRGAGVISFYNSSSSEIRNNSIRCTRTHYNIYTHTTELDSYHHFISYEEFGVIRLISSQDIDIVENDFDLSCAIAELQNSKGIRITCNHIVLDSKYLICFPEKYFGNGYIFAFNKISGNVNRLSNKFLVLTIQFLLNSLDLNAPYFAINVILFIFAIYIQLQLSDKNLHQKVANLRENSEKYKERKKILKQFTFPIFSGLIILPFSIVFIQKDTNIGNYLRYRFDSPSMTIYYFILLMIGSVGFVTSLILTIISRKKHTLKYELSGNKGINNENLRNIFWYTLIFWVFYFISQILLIQLSYTIVFMPFIFSIFYTGSRWNGVLKQINLDNSAIRAIGIILSIDMGLTTIGSFIPVDGSFIVFILRTLYLLIVLRTLRSDIFNLEDLSDHRDAYGIHKKEIMDENSV